MDRVNQAKYFDQHTEQLSELKSGDIVRMKMPAEKQWSQAVVSSKIAPRSYKVEVNCRYSTIGVIVSSCVLPRNPFKNVPAKLERMT